MFTHLWRSTSKQRALNNRMTLFQNKLASAYFIYKSLGSHLKKAISMANSNDNIVAVCQLNSTNDKSKNFTICKSLVEKASSNGAKMIFLPEAFDFIASSKEETLALSENLEGEIINNFKELAKNNDVWLSLGGMHIKAQTSSFIDNAHIIIDNLGDIKKIYNKVHLFDVDLPSKGIRLKESSYVTPGNEIITVDTAIGHLGLSICYDLRFPEVSLIQKGMGAEILTYPSAFTNATGALHWEVLLRARAIETQTYVIAAAQTGKHNPKRTSWGHAMVVDPHGNVIAQCSEGVGFALAKIDLSVIKTLSEEMPVWNHRRYDLYPKMGLSPSKEDDETYLQFGNVQVHKLAIFYKTGLTMAFTNKKCVVKGHVLVSPIRPAERLCDLQPDELSDLFQVVQRVQIQLEHYIGTNSSTITIQDGPDAGQTIKHVHVHVLPRKPGDFPENDDIYRSLEKHEQNALIVVRTEEEMIEEANILRTYFSK